MKTDLWLCAMLGMANASVLGSRKAANAKVLGAPEDTSYKSDYPSEDYPSEDYPKDDYEPSTPTSYPSDDYEPYSPSTYPSDEYEPYSTPSYPSDEYEPYSTPSYPSDDYEPYSMSSYPSDDYQADPTPYYSEPTPYSSDDEYQSDPTSYPDEEPYPTQSDSYDAYPANTDYPTGGYDTDEYGSEYPKNKAPKAWKPKTHSPDFFSLKVDAKCAVAAPVSSADPILDKRQLGLGNALGGVVNAATGVVGAVTSAAGAVVSGALPAVTGVVGGLTSVVGGVVDDATSIVGGVVDAATSVVGGVVDAATAVVGGVVNPTSVPGPVIQDVSTTTATTTATTTDSSSIMTSSSTSSIELVSSDLGGIGDATSVISDIVPSATSSMMPSTSDLSDPLGLDDPVQDAINQCTFDGFAIRLEKGIVIATPYNKWWDPKLPVFFVDDDTSTYTVSKKPLQLYVDSNDGALKYAPVGWLPPNAISVSFYKLGNNPLAEVGPSPSYFAWPTTEGRASTSLFGKTWWLCPISTTGQYQVFISNVNFGLSGQGGVTKAQCQRMSLAAVNANPWKTSGY